MAVLDDEQHRHVRIEKAFDQQREGQHHEQALHHRDRADAGPEMGLRIVEREHGERKLQQGKRSSEPQRGKAGLGDHGRPSVVVLCRAPAACGGM